MNYPCYVIHVKKGFEDREKSIEKQFADMELPFEWVVDFDIPELTENVLETYKYHGGKLRDAEISCCLKHIRAWEKIAAGSDDGGFVFEDDVLIDRKQFKKTVTHAINEFHTNWQEVGCICFGDGCAMHVPWPKQKKGQHLYESEVMRAADSYWITKKTAQLRLEWLGEKGFFLPADHLSNKIDLELRIPILWHEPTVVTQGSHSGHFRSTLQNEERGKLIDRLEWQIKKIRRRYLLPLFGWDPRVLDSEFRNQLKIYEKK